MIGDPVVIERKLLRLLVCMEERQKIGIGTNRIEEAIDGDLKQMRREKLERIPNQRAIE